jgi:signal transduction histidine kinase
MAAILAPLALLCLGLLAALGWTTVRTAKQRVVNRSADQVLTIARILDIHREIWHLRLRQLAASKDAYALADFWNANAKEVCLESLWSDSGLVGSWPSVDLLPPPDVPGGRWTGVETNPRCEGPVIRTSFSLPEGRAGVVVFRLSELAGKIRPIDRPESLFESVVVDSSGYPVLEWQGSSSHRSDPQGRLAGAGHARGGTYWRDARLHVWASAPVPNTPWFLVVRIQAIDLLRQMLPLATLVLLILLAVALLSARMAASVTRIVNTPLQELSGRIRGLEDERWVASGQPSDLAEIDELERSFDRMAVQVRQRERERREVLEARTRQLEDRERQLESAVKELESFSYSVSHDLRAPLRAIDGFSRILEEDAIARLLPEEVDALGRIRRATDRMASLIDDLLALSKATRAPLAKSRIDMTEMAREVASGLSESDPIRQVVWEIGDLGDALADPGLVRQVWINLLSNAFKFTSRSENARIRVEAHREAEGAVWIVTDNGAGFEPGGEAKLFQPFRRLHADAEFPGTGIGLALVRRIVERHGGRVGIESRLGEDTRAWFRLPAIAPSQQQD